MTTKVISRKRLEAIVIGVCEANYARYGTSFADATWMTDVLHQDPMGDPWATVKQQVLELMCGQSKVWDISENDERTDFFIWLDGVEDEWHPEW
jgi:hypothetical protein